MDSIAVVKPNMTVARQESLSPFGMLTQVFTEELVRRNGQALGSYRPLRLAYLEEGEGEQPAPPEIHFDFDVNLLVDRILKAEREKEKEKTTPERRILERVILREREIRTAYPDTRRLVIRVGGRELETVLPLAAGEQRGAAPRRSGENRPAEQALRQAGEERSPEEKAGPRRSAELIRSSSAPGTTLGNPIGTASRRSLTLASQAVSVPAGGGWTPTRREQHPGYPTPGGGEKKADGVSPGSILLPDVMRRRREAALENREAAPDLRTLEEALVWGTEGTEQSPETEQIIRSVRRAVLETLRRNEAKAASARTQAPVREAFPHGETREGQDSGLPVSREKPPVLQKAEPMTDAPLKGKAFALPAPGVPRAAEDVPEERGRETGSAQIPEATKMSVQAPAARRTAISLETETVGYTVPYPEAAAAPVNEPTSEAVKQENQGTVIVAETPKASGQASVEQGAREEFATRPAAPSVDQEPSNLRTITQETAAVSATAPEHSDIRSAEAETLTLSALEPELPSALPQTASEAVPAPELVYRQERAEAVSVEQGREAGLEINADIPAVRGTAVTREKEVAGYTVPSPGAAAAPERKPAAVKAAETPETPAEQQAREGTAARLVAPSIAPEVSALRPSAPATAEILPPAQEPPVLRSPEEETAASVPAPAPGTSALRSAAGERAAVSAPEGAVSAPPSAAGETAPETGLPAALPQTAAEAAPAPELVYRQEGAEAVSAESAQRPEAPEKRVQALAEQGTAVSRERETAGHTAQHPGAAAAPERKPASEAVRQENQEAAKAPETLKAPEQAPAEHQSREGFAAQAAAVSVPEREASAPRPAAPERAAVSASAREASAPRSAAPERAAVSAPEREASAPRSAAPERAAVSAPEREVSAPRSAAGETAPEPGFPAALPQTAAEAVPAPELVYRQEEAEAVQEKLGRETVSAQRPEAPENRVQTPAARGTAVSRERETVGHTAQYPGAAAAPERKPAADAVRRENQGAAKAPEKPRAPGQAPAEQRTREGFAAHTAAAPSTAPETSAPRTAAPERAAVTVPEQAVSAPRSTAGETAAVSASAPEVSALRSAARETAAIPAQEQEVFAPPSTEAAMAPEPGLPAALPETAAEAVPAPELVYRQKGAEALPTQQLRETVSAQGQEAPEKRVQAPAAQGTAVSRERETAGHTAQYPGAAAAPERKPAAEAVRRENQGAAKVPETPRAPGQAPAEQRAQAAAASAPEREVSALRSIAGETAAVSAPVPEVSALRSAAGETAAASTPASEVSALRPIAPETAAASAPASEVSAPPSPEGETAVSAPEPGLPAALPQTAAEAVPAPELVYRQEGAEAVREEQRGETVSAQRQEVPETRAHAPAEQGTAVSRERETAGHTPQHPGMAAAPERKPAAEAVRRETQEAAKAREMPKAPGQAPAEQQTREGVAAQAAASAPASEVSAPRSIAGETAAASAPEQEVSALHSAAPETAAASAPAQEASAPRSPEGETAVSATEPGLPAALPQTAAEAVPAPELVYRQEGAEAVREEQWGETVSAQRPEAPETTKQGTAVFRERETPGHTEQYPGEAAASEGKPAAQALPEEKRAAAEAAENEAARTEAVRQENRGAAEAFAASQTPGQAPAVLRERAASRESGVPGEQEESPRAPETRQVTERELSTALPAGERAAGPAGQTELVYLRQEVRPGPGEQSADTPPSPGAAEPPAKAGWEVRETSAKLVPAPEAERREGTTEIPDQPGDIPRRAVRPEAEGLPAAVREETLPGVQPAQGSSPTAIPAQENPETPPERLVYRADTAENLPAPGEREAGTPRPGENRVPGAEERRAALPREGRKPAPAPISQRDGAEMTETIPPTPRSGAERREAASGPRREGRERSGEVSADTAGAKPAAERPMAETRPGERPSMPGAAAEAKAGEEAPSLALPGETRPEAEYPPELIYREQSGAETGAQPERSGARSRQVSTGQTAAIPRRPSGGGEGRQETAPSRSLWEERRGQSLSHAAPTSPTLRDVRVTAQNVRSLLHTPEPGARPTGRAEEAAPGELAFPVPGPEATAPAELVYAALPQGGEPAPEETALRPVEKAAREDPAESLPPWARELLEQNGGGDAVQKTILPSGTTASPRQITWTAPGAMPGQPARTASGPAEISFKEPRQAEENEYRTPISDAELQRTADKVYRLIEERLRRELRRSGR